MQKNGNPSGHSLIQRIEYVKNAAQIIKRNFWTGVGTGDVKDEFMSQYENSESQLDLKWRLRAHNQYVTFLLTFGIIGFSWIMFSFFFPVFYEKKHLDFLAIIFLLIAFLSMLNEDTLETHTGISFFAFFYSFFILGYKKKI
ncbi:MAG: O-antigen ligase family protein [Bacteroidales bacterium]|nr:O-antigen ligase family protein [Bacteroidales bacterium]